MAKNGLIIHYDLLEQLEDFTDEQFGIITRAMIKYDKDGVIPDFKDNSIKIAFKIIKPLLDKNKQEYETKCNKNRENVKKRWEKEDTNVYERIQSNTNATDIDIDIDIDNDIDNKYIVEQGTTTYQEIVDYLNKKAGTSFKYNSKKTKEKINARLNEKYTIEDFKKVIDNKCKSWKGTEMQRYLRPETLFGNKFESYLNEKVENKFGILTNDYTGVDLDKLMDDFSTKDI